MSQAAHVVVDVVLAAFAQQTHCLRATQTCATRGAGGALAASEGVAYRFELGQAARIAEARLPREVSKLDLACMRVSGQFNKGFILAQLRGDVFIVDQHASDEKHIYESIRVQCTLHQQPLIMPQPLPLSRQHEEVVLAHMDL